QRASLKKLLQLAIAICESKKTTILKDLRKIFYFLFLPVRELPPAAERREKFLCLRPSAPRNSRICEFPEIMLDFSPPGQYNIIRWECANDNLDD
ncbi:MAG: hypothetical protein LUH45_02535, partial [Clostridiales bacterium]|nr:hypothetical protein [Clostridiales bacterium]